MPFIKKLFFAIFITVMFFALLSISSSVNMLSFSSLLMLLIVYLPLFLSGFWLGYIGLFVVFSISLFLIYDGVSSFLLFIALFFIPVLIITLYYRFIKLIEAGAIISMLTIYSAIMVVIGFLAFPEVLSFNNLYDTIYFLVLSMNSEDSKLFSEINNLEQTVSNFVFFVPAMMGILLMFWIFLNHQLAVLILKDNQSKFVNLDVKKRYFPIKYYNGIFVLVIILTLLAHNFLAKYVDLYYILYNVLLILLAAYLYLGMEVIWKKLKASGNIFVLIIFSVAFFFMFLESLIILSVVGFLVAIKIIPHKE